MGSVLLMPHRVHRFFTLFGAAALAALLALLVFGKFTNTAHVTGWLVPQAGMVHVLAPRPGVVTSLPVGEGEAVQRGQRLLVLSDELQSAALGATQAEMLRRLDQRRRSLAEQAGQLRRLLAQQQAGLAARIAALGREQEQIEREIGIKRSRVAVAEHAESLQAKLAKEGFISEQRVQLAVAETLEQRARLETLERERLAISRQRLTLEEDLRDLPLKIGKELTELERAVAQLEQERAELEARREIVVPAPQDGTVTGIVAVPGRLATAGMPLLSLVPANTKLEAHLYSPSRAIGFVRPGQRVLLRYQSYPFQKFGHHEGTVIHVSRSPIGTAERPALAPGEQPSRVTPAGIIADEAAYRISVALARQTVTAHGEEHTLQPGMLLEADILLDTRHLYEWLLEPLFTVSGRWQ